MKRILIASTLALTALVYGAPTALATHSVTAGTVVLTARIDVPAAAKATLARLYPGAKSVKWSKEGGNYEAGLTRHGRKLSLVINAKGQVLETEMTIAVSALPAFVRDYIAKHRPGINIKEAAEIVDAKGKKTYEAEVGGKDLIFDKKGQLIN